MIVLGADMHKSSHTIAAVSAISGELLGDKTIQVGDRGFAAALDWARGLGAERVWALEDCRLLPLDRKTLYETVPAESDALIELTKLVEQRKASLENIIARATLVAPEQAATTVAISGQVYTTDGIDL